ncbi:MAG: alkaline phosphatase family protein [Anaerolineae bacterium]|nr:alkaline phosphatase family protein [Anaerolineae bacterium]
MTTKLLFLDIDGLRPDVFRAALAAGTIPHLAGLLGGSDLTTGLIVDTVAPAPSITFCSQACLFTGHHPKRHGIPGNQFFDRFGTYNNGLPRHFAFDVGDTLAVDDAVRVFVDGLASNRLLEPTIYEKLTAQGKTSVVAGNMYAKGAQTWLKPSLTNLARFTKGGNLFGMDSAEYDGYILDAVIEHLQKHGMPDLLTVYFMGLDHDSHHYGPAKGQMPYLVDHVDPMVGKLLDAISPGLSPASSLFVALFSDHGQIEVIPDDQHSLHIGFPFDKEMGHLFNALGLDVHDFPGEDPNCDAVMALNGGLAYVYLQKKDGHWADVPLFERDVLPVGKAFWEAHTIGKYAPELKGALAGVLLRNVERDGWEAKFQALTPAGGVIPPTDWFATQPDGQYTDPVHRLDNHTGLYSGDILLISHYAEGYYFGKEIHGVHGGLHPDDSLATLAYAMPGAGADDWARVKGKITGAIEARCADEGGRMPATCDMLVGVEAVLG